jgi:hypothetical protein
MRSTIGRITAAILAAALIAGATIPTAFAGNAGSTTVYQEAIEFTLPAGTCPSLPEDLEVHFTGTLHGHIHVSTDANGVVHINWPDTISGTASDSDGGTYRFNYHNEAVIRDAGFPIDITITDHFNLVGNGAANHLHTFFVLRLVITEDGETEVVFHEHGDPGQCDAL